MTDTITVGSITQLVQLTGRVSWFPPMERNEFTFVVQPDPRDAFIAEQEARYFKLETELNDANARIAELKTIAINVTATAQGLAAMCRGYERRTAEFEARIAQLEASLREIRERTSKHKPLSVQDVLIMRAVDAVLPRPPEGDMSITVEELEA